MNISKNVMYVELHINNFHFFSVICIERHAWGEREGMVHHIITMKNHRRQQATLLLHGIRLFLINNYEAKA